MTEGEVQKEPLLLGQTPLWKLPIHVHPQIVKLIALTPH
jgi:hypothetical protein